jgi:hypothetical protein
VLRETLLEQSTSKALEEWNAKKATDETILFSDAWLFITALYTVNNFHALLPGDNLRAKLEKMADNTSGTISAL